MTLRQILKYMYYRKQSRSLSFDNDLTTSRAFMSKFAFVAKVDQGQNEKNMQSDFLFTMSIVLQTLET